VSATVDMGMVDELGEPDGWSDLGCHPDRPVSHLSLGNPHSVVGVDDVTVVDLVALGEKVPQVNLEIVEPGPESHAITMRVHERGAGITEACGTGACAAAFAARSWGLVASSEREVVVHMDGGTATVGFDPDEPRRVALTGPATHIATLQVVVDRRADPGEL
jgi:diaminopimelate epimerase